MITFCLNLTQVIRINYSQKNIPFVNFMLFLVFKMDYSLIQFIVLILVIQTQLAQLNLNLCGESDVPLREFCHTNPYIAIIHRKYYVNGIKNGILEVLENNMKMFTKIADNVELTNSIYNTEVSRI